MTIKNNKPPLKPFSNRTDKGKSPALPGSKPRPAPSAASRLNKSSNLRSRFGSTPIAWDVLPVGDTLVCFSLEGLGGSLKYMMQDDLSAASGSYEAVLQSIEQDTQAQAQLTAILDDMWNAYEMTGAMLVYSWKDSTRDVIRTDAQLSNRKPVYLRAFDPLLVLNVLARSRDNLLQATAPVSFDATYIDRTIISDDPRLVKLVQMSGYFEMEIPAPLRPPEVDEEDDE